MSQTGSLHWNVFFTLLKATTGIVGVLGQDAVTVGRETGLNFIFAKIVMEA
jgi:hypothetical protein